MRVALLVALAALVAVPVASAKPKTVMTPADQAAIDRLLDRFVPEAIGREHAERAWPLSTAHMHLGTTIADWRAGTLTVQPFPVVGRSFHGWTVDSAGPNDAQIVLLVHLRKGNQLGLGGASFDLGLKKVHGRWLVDDAVVAATFAAEGTPSKILAGNDFGPGSSPDPYSKVKFGLHSELPGAVIWAIPALLLAVIVLVPLGILYVHKRRDRAPVSDERRERVFRTSR